MEDYVRLREVKKIYKMGEVEIAAADGIDFSVGKGEFAVVVGASGAGRMKSIRILIKDNKLQMIIVQQKRNMII